MGNFEIIQRNGNKIDLQSREPFCAIKSATQNTSLMGDDNVQISFVSSELYTFGKGDKIIVGSEEYTIRTQVQREMISEGHYQYEATFYGVMYELMKSLYRNAGEDGKSTTSSFDLTYSIRDFVKVLIYNVNRDYPGLWVFDEENCPDTEPRTISFSKQNCLQVLQSLCSDNEFGLEFQITQDNGTRTIHIGKFGSKVNPPNGSEYFEWGKGNGLYKLKEQKVDDKTIITRLWVEGGSTNIKSGYRNYSERLQLPYPRRVNKNDHKLADGTVVKAGSEYIGIDDDNKRYLEDSELRDALGSDEDAVTFDDIHPKRTGEVTAIGSDINSFTDDTMDFDLCEKDDNGTKYLIEGVAAKITFISGKLAGQQFELAEKGGYDHATKTFTLIPFTDNRGLTIPTTDTEAFRISVGDRYKLTDINMPDSYVENAEEELWYAGMDEFTPRTQARAQYELTFDRSYFLSNLPSDSEATIFHVGDYLPVKDERFGIEKTIRINKIARNLLAEHDYNITLSDIVVISVINQTIVDVKGHEHIIQLNHLRDLTKMRRGWRTTEELRTMVYDTDGYFDPENIRPNSIDTNMLTVGSKSQQFVLSDVVLQANVNGLPNRFNASAGALLHLSIDEKEVKQWNLSAAEFTMANNKGYYLFAKCSKSGNTGTWYLTQEQLKVETTEDPNNYCFQVGIVGSLNSDDNFRDFTTTYGFTRINGNTITTGKIVTSDKQSYLDLDNNRFCIGDNNSGLSWNANGDHVLRLKGTLVQSSSGDTSPIGCYRGVYQYNYTYYKGDEVTFTLYGNTSTYRYISDEATIGIAPTDTSRWQVIAQGARNETTASGNMWPNPLFLPGLSLIGDDAPSDVTVPTTGMYARLLKTRDHFNTDTNVPISYGHTYRIMVFRKRIAGSLELNAGIWGNRNDGGYLDGYHAPNQVDDLSGDWAGWQRARYDLTISSAKSSMGCLFFQVDQAVGSGATQWLICNPIWTDITSLQGDKYEYRYAKNGSTSTPPSLASSDRNPNGWSTTQPSVGSFEYLWMTIAKIDSGGNLSGTWSTPVRTTPYDGQDGAAGATGPKGDTGATGPKGDKGDKGDSPVSVFRGSYSSSSTYYGNSGRLDIVKYNGSYYVARIDAGTFSGVPPTNTSKWNSFGAQFESVATNLLLAENANIAGFTYADEKMKSSDASSLILDGVNGSLIAKKGYIGGFLIGTNSIGTINTNNVYIGDRMINIGTTSDVLFQFNTKKTGSPCFIYGASSNGDALQIRGITHGFKVPARNGLYSDEASGMQVVFVSSEGNTTVYHLPSLSTSHGKVLFFAPRTNCKYRVYGQFYHNDAVFVDGSSYRDFSRPSIFVCDGSYWYCFYCG